MWISVVSASLIANIDFLMNAEVDYSFILFRWIIE